MRALVFGVAPEPHEVPDTDNVLLRKLAMTPTRLDRDYPDALLNLGVLYEEGKSKLGLDPERARSLYRRALAAGATGETRTKAEEYLRALSK